MRLLDTNTGQFRTVHDPRKERYAIISHTWAEEGEQTYKDILEIQQCAEQRYLGAIAHQKIHEMQEDPTAPCHHCHNLSSIPLDAPSFPSDLLSDPLMPGLPGPLDLVRRKKAKPYDGVRSALPKGIRTLSSVARALATPLPLVIRRLVSFFTRGTILVRHSLYALIAQVATYVRLPIISSPGRGDVPRRGGGLHHSNIPGASPESDAVSSPELLAPTTPVHDHEYGTPPHVIDGRRADARRHAPIFTDPRVSEKIRMACCLAAKIGMELVWMDSCCIDQDSSAELSEAINSMYEWYECSTICLVFLSDVDSDDDLNAPRSQFRKSRWHSRGWTLQELIAPRYHIFYSRDWKRLGTKMSLARTLAEVTGIDRVILNHEMSVDHVSVAQRMFWASRRATTRVEDQAYALMGIFGVHMPTIYGEGRKAFIRLQEEILRHTYDQTIFAWGPCWRRGEVPDTPTESDRTPRGAFVSEMPFMDMYGLLANSPHDFKGSDGVHPIDHWTLVGQLGLNAELLPYPEYIISHDIRTRLPLLPADDHRVGLPEAYWKLKYHRLALLACRDRDGALVALPLIRSTTVADYTNGVGATMEPDLAVYYHMFALAPAELDRLLADISVHDVRIFRRAPTMRLDAMCAMDIAPISATRFTLQAVAPEAWSCAALTDQGFHTTVHERRDTASYDILLTRAGKAELELIIISAVFLRSDWPDPSTKWYSSFHHFEVAYKSARRSHREEGFKRRECVEISRDREAPYIRWTMWRLPCTSGEMRTLRLSFKWHRLVIPRISIELTEPCHEDEVPELPAVSMSAQALDMNKYDELERYLQTLWYLFIPPASSPMAIPYFYAMWLHGIARQAKAAGWAPELLLNALRDVHEDDPMWQECERAVEQGDMQRAQNDRAHHGSSWPWISAGSSSSSSSSSCSCCSSTYGERGGEGGGGTRSSSSSSSSSSDDERYDDRGSEGDGRGSGPGDGSRSPSLPLRERGPSTSVSLSRAGPA